MFTAERFTFSQLADKAFSGLLNETKHRSVSLLAPVFGVVTFSATLLIAIDRLYGGVDIDTDPAMIYPKLLPHPFTKILISLGLNRLSR